MQYFSRSVSRSKRLVASELYEPYVDNFWFEAADFENQCVSEPLVGECKADIVIIGGGYTGLSSAYHLSRRFPEKGIVLLEGARCGFGASGRNGGFCITTDMLDDAPSGSESDRRDALEVSSYGLTQIKHFVDEHQVDCDLMENGRLELAMTENETRSLERIQRKMKAWGLGSTLLQGESLKAEIDSPRFIAGIALQDCATLNPAKLALGMKRVVLEAGVEIRERSVVNRIVPGKVHRIETAHGRVDAPVMVLAMNGYSHKLGLFQNRVFPLCSYIIATKPLTDAQWDSIGLVKRRGFADMRVQFDYAAPSADGRIVIGGSDYPYYPNDGLSRGHNEVVTKLLIEDLFTTFPQLEGLEIEHAWGGTMSGTRDLTPSIGVMGEYANIYYGVGYFEGVPASQTAGRIIADLMGGEKNAFTEHPLVNRKIPYAGPKWARRFAIPLCKFALNRFAKDRSAFA